MSMNTPIGGITQITPIKNFQEISELDNEQYLLGIKDSSTGSGGKVKFETLISDSISENNDNIITTGTDGKLLVNTPPQIGNLSNLTTTNKSTLVGAINEVDGDVGNLVDLTTSVKTNIVNAINSEVSARGTAETNIQNDYNGKIGTLSNLDTTYKSNIVGAINEIAAIAEPSLQYETMNNSKALETGAPFTNTTILADIQKYAHSTFDRSKFTVVGSPIITDNGIASGFSTTNYLTTPAIDMRNKKFKIECAFNTGNSLTDDYQVLLSLCKLTYFTVLGICTKNNEAKFFIQDGTNDKTVSASITTNTNYTASIEFTGTQYKFILNGVVIDTYASTNGIQALSGGVQLNGTENFGIGCYVQNNNIEIKPFLDGSVNLKGVNITVDGVEVFSGNKTGIDTIKPDDYTVVGTPIISADGVASGFSTTNYINTPQVINFAKAMTIETNFIYASSSSNQFIISSNDGQFRVEIASNFMQVKYSNVKTFFVAFGTNLSVGDNVKIRITLNDNGYNKFTLWINDILTKNVDDDTTDFSTLTYSLFRIGVGTQDENKFNGSIDLNAFKIYADGNLVYQPCLKIPYTESHSGSKIADAIYRDRVVDAYEQGYDYRYYTLSDTDFTLPLGEIYGDIENCLNVNTATQAEKNAVMGWGVPDYSRAVAFNPTSGQSVGFNGWLQANAYNTAENQWFTASINNIPFLSTAGGSQGGIPDAASNVVPVKADDVLTFTNVGNYGFNKIPYVGGNL